MKKEQEIRREIGNLKSRLSAFRQQQKTAKMKGIWHLETAVRTSLRVMNRSEYQGNSDIAALRGEYIALLDELSTPILDKYNRQHGTAFTVENVKQGNERAYLRSGILAVLTTNHIPNLMAAQFSRLLPPTPMAEYPLARQIQRTLYLHLGETNTGKTYDAMQRLMAAPGGVYLSPLRILALEIFETMNKAGVPCDLLTGEEEIRVPGARHVSCTIEKLDTEQDWPVAVVDEAQLMGDARRGDAWTRALLGLCCPEIHVCGALSAREQLYRMAEDCADKVEEQLYTRAVPLKIVQKRIPLSRVQTGDALVTFSKRNVLNLSRQLAKMGIRSSVIYGDLPPEVRRMQYEAFLSGESRVLISTDAIGLGVNLPIRRIIFTDIRKFDGDQFRYLTSQEVKQIAGRAGRLGIYDVGYVGSLEGEASFLQEQLEAEDMPLTQAIVGPNELLTKMDMLPLDEKLALWATREEDLPHYAKKDVRESLMVLSAIKPYHLPDEVQWKLMKIPFDVGRDEILSQFQMYMLQYFKTQEAQLTPPVLTSHSLPACECYYQKLNLYYSFSRAMNLPFDQEYINLERKAVSEEINSLL